ncbi:TIGR03668 family PPOX class F420-dependent oxidoreductase [Streptomyces daliensis]|uniref:TIGR03668 family PPOX class F420-dependent oxidoreductase n=1 Tax=Streptomyces daliensis TaxID=299421 RepID=A0A8T4ISK6_9ACTN|nr:TIGR03668 family PPOX class F420-dependent oxidoreductase [Streptomyces daliensis]
MATLTGAEARAAFAGSRVARLATVDADGRPHLVPVVFAVTGDTVVTAVDHKPKRTTRLKRLANIEANPAVCLLVDAYDEEWEHLWWARADGTARVLPPASDASDACDASDTTGASGAADAARSAELLGLLVEKYGHHYAGRPPRGPVTEVTVGRWSGWRLG